MPDGGGGGGGGWGEGGGRGGRGRTAYTFWGGSPCVTTSVFHGWGCGNSPWAVLTVQASILTAEQVLALFPGLSHFVFFGLHSV